MNDNQKDTLIEAHDLWAAISLLTRISVPVDHSRAGIRAKNATWAYPIVGALIGTLSGIIFLSLNSLGLSPGFCAAITLLLLIAITGGMHEDGLADCADGFWGGQNSVRRLEIMKDSSIGVYGACTLILFLIAQWSLFELLISQNPIWTLAGIGAISRLPMVIAMRFVPNARNNGLSATVGKPQLISIHIAIITTFIIALICFGISGFLIILIGLLFALPVFVVAKAKIGGQTGDVLGASQKFAEMATLAAALAL